MAASVDADIEDDDVEEAHDINVTPFIDVMLVLLIIFGYLTAASAISLSTS
jgi:biopolymer transport protein ExbD